MINMGFAGFRHAHIYSLYDMARENENVRIAGAWEENEAAREVAQTEHGVKFTYNTYREMLEDSSVDAIAIGDCYGARGQIAIEALKSGKHVIADKPLCTSTSELKEIEALAKEKNLKVGLMLDMRYTGNVSAAKKAIVEGRIGTVNNISFGGQHPLLYGVRPSWYFEEGKHGGVINDIAIHGIDLVRYMTGLEVEEILSARCWNAFAVHEKDFKDSGQMMLRLNNGAGVIADVSYAVPDSIGFKLPYYWSIKVWGTKGMLSFTVQSAGVELYADGSTSVEVLCSEANGDCLKDFVADIQLDSAVNLDTCAVLQSSLQTLLIQENADKNVKR